MNQLYQLNQVPQKTAWFGTGNKNALVWIITPAPEITPETDLTNIILLSEDGTILTHQDKDYRVHKFLASRSNAIKILTARTPLWKSTNSENHQPQAENTPTSSGPPNSNST